MKSQLIRHSDHRDNMMQRTQEQMEHVERIQIETSGTSRTHSTSIELSIEQKPLC